MPRHCERNNPTPFLLSAPWRESRCGNWRVPRCRVGATHSRWHLLGGFRIPRCRCILEFRLTWRSGVGRSYRNLYPRSRVCIDQHFGAPHAQPFVLDSWSQWSGDHDVRPYLLGADPGTNTEDLTKVLQRTHPESPEPLVTRSVTSTVPITLRVMPSHPRPTHLPRTLNSGAMR